MLLYEVLYSSFHLVALREGNTEKVGNRKGEERRNGIYCFLNPAKHALTNLGIVLILGVITPTLR